MPSQQRLFFAAMLAIGIAGVQRTPVLAQLPAEVLKDTKNATVFIRIAASGGGSTGSGFVYKINDTKEALVVTNDHVISGWEKLPEKATKSRYLNVIFHSGQANETTLNAQVLATDPELDIAILRVKPKEGFSWPKPLEINPKLEIVETLPVYPFGFPFGNRLAEAKENPAVTVGKGAISSIRGLKKGQSKVYQLDADLNPGNSGGPIVSGQGELVAVARSKINATGISFGIPATEIDRIFAGKPGELSIEGQKIGGVKTAVFTLPLIDPGKKMQAVRVLYRMEGPNPKFVEPKEPYTALPYSDALPLKFEVGRATGKLNLPNINRDVVAFTFQVAYQLEPEKWIYTAPLIHEFSMDRMPSGSGVGSLPRTPTPLNPRPATQQPPLPDPLLPGVRPGMPAMVQGPRADFTFRPKDPEGVTMRDAVEPAEKIDLLAKVSRIIIDPEGKYATFINRTDLALQRVNLATMKLDETKLPLDPGANVLAASLDRKTLYAAVVDERQPGGLTEMLRSRILVIDAAAMKITDTIEVEGQVIDLAPLSDGRLYMLLNAGFQKFIAPLDPKKRNVVGRTQAIGGPSFLRGMPDGSRLYATSEHAVGPMEAILPPTARGPLASYRSPYFQLSQSGPFEIAPDNRNLVNMHGHILRLSKTPGEDLQYVDTIEDHHASAWDVAGKKLWTAGEKLRSHSSENFKPADGYPLPGPAYRIAIDPKSRLMLLALNMPAAEEAPAKGRSAPEAEGSPGDAKVEGIGPLLIYKLDQFDGSKK